MSWTSPWTGLRGLAQKAAELGKDLEKSIDKSMGVTGEEGVDVGSGGPEPPVPESVGKAMTAPEMGEWDSWGGAPSHKPARADKGRHAVALSPPTTTQWDMESSLPGIDDEPEEEVPAPAPAAPAKPAAGHQQPAPVPLSPGPDALGVQDSNEEEVEEEEEEGTAVEGGGPADSVSMSLLLSPIPVVASPVAQPTPAPMHTAQGLHPAHAAPRRIMVDAAEQVPKAATVLPPAPVAYVVPSPPPPSSPSPSPPPQAIPPPPISATHAAPPALPTPPAAPPVLPTPPGFQPEATSQHPAKSGPTQPYVGQAPAPPPHQQPPAPAPQPAASAPQAQAAPPAASKAELEEVAALRAALQAKVAEVAGANKRADGFRQQWQALADRTMAQLDAVDQLSGALETAKKASARCMELEEKLDLVSTELKERNRQLESLSAQAGETMHEASAASSELIAARAEIDRLKAALAAESEASKQQQKELSKLKSASGSVERLQQDIAERDKRLEEILIEAESLSKRQATQETAIRTLRGTTRKAEEDAQIAAEKQAAAEAALLSLQERMAALEYEASDAKRAQSSLAGEATSHSKKARALEDKVAQLTAQNQQLQSALVAAQADAESQKKIVREALAEAEAAEAAQEKAESAAASAIVAAEESRRQQAALEAELKELRDRVMLGERSSGAREDALQKELAQMRERWQAAESRCEELEHGAGVSAATQPLLDQIAALQHAANTKRAEWNASRTSLQSRVAEAEASARLADSERKAAEGMLVESSKELAQLRAEMSGLRTAKARSDAAATLNQSANETAQRRAQELSEELAEVRAELDKHTAELHDSRRKLGEETGRRDQLEQMVGLLRAQLTRVSAEAEDGAAAISKLKAHLAGVSGYDGINALPDAVRSSPNPLSDKGDAPPDPALSKSVGMGLSGRVGDTVLAKLGPAGVPMGEDDGSGTGGSDGQFGAVSVARLQALVRARAGEIKALQHAVTQAEKDKAALTDELVALTTKNAQMEALIQDLEASAVAYKEALARNGVLLELLGEREEQIEEMKAELEDVKDTYRIQLDELLLRLATQSR